jgi:molybdenum cofactor biosynthesis protein B
MPDDHHHDHDAQTVAFGVLTISSSRTLEEDGSGDALVAAIESDGHEVAVRDLVGDEERAIRRRVDGFIDREDVDAVVTTGGTGVTPDDVTVEALSPLFDRTLPGFGEQFRARSVEQVGPHAMISRATAGIVDLTPVFCLPGSTQAAEFGASELVLPVVGHVIGLLQGGSHDHSHDHDHGHDHGEGQGEETHTAGEGP